MEDELGTFSAKEYKIDAETLKKAFMWCSGIGVAAIIMLRLSNAHIWFAIAFGIVIMSAYLYQFKKGGEPHALIDTFSDSVYYLGFVLTLVSLIIAMIFFDMNEGALSASYILTQFGAAMTTTLLGLLFRIYYKQFDTTVESAQLSAREALDETVKGFNIQMRSTNNSLTRLAKTIDKNIEDTELRNQKSMELYEDAQKKIIALGEASIDVFGIKIEERLNKSISSLDALMESSSLAMEQHVKNSLASNSLIAQQNNDLLKSSLESLFQKMTAGFVEPFNTLSVLVESLNGSLTDTGQSAKSLNKAFSKTGEAAIEQLSKIESFTPNFQAIEASQNVFINGLDKLTLGIKDKVKSVSEFDHELGKHLTGLISEYKSLLEEYKSVTSGSGIHLISEEEQKLINVLQERRQSLESLSTRWNSDVKGMSENAQLFAENLVKTSQFITNELRTAVPSALEKAI